MTLGMTLTSLGVRVPDPGMQMGNLIQPLFVVGSDQTLHDETQASGHLARGG